MAIDDEPDSLELIKDTLTQQDVDIKTAGDPIAGWELVRREYPEIVLLDLRMLADEADAATWPPE